MKTYINLTPHSVVVGTTCYAPSGNVARVAVSYTEIENNCCSQQFGEVENLPAPCNNTRYIVSGLVFAATDRKDVVAPATGHPDVVRNNKGHIVSVPAFVIH